MHQLTAIRTRCEHIFVPESCALNEPSDLYFAQPEMDGRVAGCVFDGVVRAAQVENLPALEADGSLPAEVVNATGVALRAFQWHCTAMQGWLSEDVEWPALGCFAWCGEHGVCSGDLECVCDPGYSGTACDIPTSCGSNASSVAWCSGHGLCVLDEPQAAPSCLCTEDESGGYITSSEPFVAHGGGGGVALILHACCRHCHGPTDVIRGMSAVMESCRAQKSAMATHPARLAIVASDADGLIAWVAPSLSVSRRYL